MAAGPGRPLDTTEDTGVDRCTGCAATTDPGDRGSANTGAPGANDTTSEVATPTANRPTQTRPGANTDPRIADLPNRPM